MEKVGVHTRDIRFFSQKNQKMICVHSQAAKDYAKYLEDQPHIIGYETCELLRAERFQYVSPLNIRKEYWVKKWTTDFLLHYADGRTGVREVLDKQDLTKRADVEKLELSRRYWAGLDVSDWKVVITKEGVSQDDSIRTAGR
jgi:hypothetical protein